MSVDDLDLAHRRLCPDGACIGVVGADGKCKVCGRAADSDADADADNDSDWDPAADSDAGADSDTDAATAAAADTDAFDPDRRLCPDGACIGVIGPNGRCNECGRAAVSS